MRPSEGDIQVSGRVSPLLELGTGFNPEYTGIENARLNATVLGLSPDDIKRKEQQIADFADIGEYIDRPVRTYSSGMFARLAFSVAISVDPQILLVDEILAVGDMGFQQKCLNRLREMREEGLTLVFVSHSPDAVKSVCDQAIFLDHGLAMYVGEADRAVDQYLAFIREQTNLDQLKR
jgi:lipopolysaccharide transport system ATP-binding protein